LRRPRPFIIGILLERSFTGDPGNRGRGNGAIPIPFPAACTIKARKIAGWKVVIQVEHHPLPVVFDCQIQIPAFVVGICGACPQSFVTTAEQAFALGVGAAGFDEFLERANCLEVVARSRLSEAALLMDHRKIPHRQWKSVNVRKGILPVCEIP
jgi:hypothetical protein